MFDDKPDATGWPTVCRYCGEALYSSRHAHARCAPVPDKEKEITNEDTK